MSRRGIQALEWAKNDADKPFFKNKGGIDNGHGRGCSDLGFGTLIFIFILIE